MALPANTHWRVRAGGDALNGGGFCPGGSGTDYSDSDTPILSLTDLATTGTVTTVTSATGGFTANMVDNILRVASGTNSIPGYYRIVTFTDSNTVELDRTPASGAMSGGVGRIGGAFATPWGNLSTGGTVTAPTITSPLAPGHTINVRGPGVDAPGSADYDIGTNYASFPSGTTAGRIKMIGYNGRPRIDCSGICFYNLTGWYAKNFSSVITGTTYSVYGLFDGPDVLLVDIRVDQAGFDVQGLQGAAYFGCRLINTGSTASGTKAAIKALTGALVYGTVIDGWRGPCIDNGAAGYALLHLLRSVFANCRSTTIAAVRLTSAFALSYRHDIMECVFYGNAHDGLSIAGNTTYDAEVAGTTRLMNNVFAENAGYGVRYSGTLAGNDALKGAIDYNAFYNNASGDLYLLTNGDNDITLSADPFIDGANGDFSLNSDAGGGALLKGAAFPDF